MGLVTRSSEHAVRGEGVAGLASPITTFTREEALPQEPLSIAWVGSLPGWMALPDARGELDAARISFRDEGRRSRDLLPVVRDAPDIVHLADANLRDSARLRELFPASAILLDLGLEAQSNGSERRSVARHRAAVDLIVLGSRLELREVRRRHPSLAGRTVLLERPLDLASHVPAYALRDQPAYRKFIHERGLDDPDVVLFAGPFTASGALDVAITAVARLARRIPSIKLVALCDGDVDRRYVKRCKRLADRLAAPVLWAGRPSDGELPFWYAAAAVVFMPSRNGQSAEPSRLAAAAGLPVVGSEIEALLERVVDEETGFLVEVDDIGGFAHSLAALLASEELRERFGRAARRRIEAEASPSVAARRLVGIWREAVRRRGRTTGERVDPRH